jgi:hypothetical protein
MRVEPRLRLDRRDVAELAVQAPVVVPVDIFRDRDLKVDDAIQWADVADEFGFEE